MDDEKNLDGKDMDPSVPTDLLELYVDLEEADVTPKEFKEAFSG